MSLLAGEPSRKPERISVVIALLLSCIKGGVSDRIFNMAVLTMLRARSDRSDFIETFPSILLIVLNDASKRVAGAIIEDVDPHPACPHSRTLVNKNSRRTL
jgi:hypothetical protein